MKCVSNPRAIPAFRIAYHYGYRQNLVKDLVMYPNTGANDYLAEALYQRRVHGAGKNTAQPAPDQSKLPVLCT